MEFGGNSLASKASCSDFAMGFARSFWLPDFRYFLDYRGGSHSGPQGVISERFRKVNPRFSQEGLFASVYIPATVNNGPFWCLDRLQSHDPNG